LPPFDLHSPLLSLPRAFGTRLETIPSEVPYLRAEALAAANWRTRLDQIAGRCPKIGIVWAGRPYNHSSGQMAMDRRRSMSPERLTPLFDIPGLKFFSLQKSGPSAPAAFPLIDLMNEVDDFADTAALITNLDLVISVDTAVAHLAAALGKQVWLMNRFDSCWRWLEERKDSPWYPTLRIYRQSRPGEWDPVINQIGCDLRRFVT
jgi:Glycosyltransferase family 9 (heptosyltransferase)